ncbi:LysR family transcriptional regulator [Oceanobacillus longus]|uniref:LysR family transcriptional regulator n=1 Tax=Oceanobacillus longus TaxID=930120 RepID=A0ABV8H1Y1_9BACI
MRIDHFIYILEVAKLESISLAAEKLHVSQPTISQAIKSMEIEWGGKLFHRSRLGALPTKEGIIIIKKIKEIVNKLEEIKEVNTTNSDSITGTLSISAVPGISQSLLPMTLADFINTFPKVTFNISENGSEQITKDVLNEKVDIGFVAYSQENAFKNHNKLEFKPLVSSPVMACVGKKSPLAMRDSISFEEIVEHPLFLYDKGYSLQRHIIEKLTQYGDLNILFASSNSLAGKQILSEGIGIGFFTKITLKNDPYFTTGMLVPLELENQKIIHYYGYLRRKDSYLPKIYKEFIQILVNHL